MERKILKFTNRNQFRKWLEKNYKTAKECFTVTLYGKPKDNKHLWYFDAIEEALCFGWIDSTKFKDAKLGVIQRWSPRSKKSHWTMLNRIRIKRLIKLGLMTQAGLDVVDNLDTKLVIYPEVKKILKDKVIKKNFESFPKLYQLIRIDSIQRYKDIGNDDLYLKALENFKKQTKANKMYGQWNDYGRLLDK